MTENGLTNLLKCQKLSDWTLIFVSFFDLESSNLSLRHFGILTSWEFADIFGPMFWCIRNQVNLLTFSLSRIFQKNSDILTHKLCDITLPRTVQLRTPDLWTNPDIRLGERRVIKIALSVLSTSKLDQIHDLKLN